MSAGQAASSGAAGVATAAGPAAIAGVVFPSAPGGSGEGAGGSVHAGTPATASHSTHERIAVTVTSVLPIEEIFDRSRGPPE
jgi:hypothetical protein